LSSQPELPELFVEATLQAPTREFLDLLLASQRECAASLVQRLVEGGTPLQSIYLNVLQPALREVGRRWQIGLVSVGQEHYCTAATQAIMGQHYERIFRTPRTGHLLAAAGVSGELHDVGLRMVADFFEMSGWDTQVLGASASASDVVSFLVSRPVDVLAISVTIASHVQEVRTIIGAVRGSSAAHVPIMVGGRPFNRAPWLSQRVGADGYAPDAEAAVALGQSWIQGSGGDAP
jgi:methanogenic corrinoid protein MtbC1